MAPPDLVSLTLTYIPLLFLYEVAIYLVPLANVVRQGTAPPSRRPEARGGHAPMPPRGPLRGTGGGRPGGGTTNPRPAGGEEPVRNVSTI